MNTNTKLYIALGLCMSSSMLFMQLTNAMHCAPDTQRRLNSFGIWASKKIDDATIATRRWFVQQERDHLLATIRETKRISDRTTLAKQGFAALLVKAQAVEVKHIENMHYWNNRWWEVNNSSAQMTLAKVRSLQFRKDFAKITDKIIREAFPLCLHRT